MCIRFTNTVGERRSSAPSEYFVEPADLQRWLADQSLLPHGADIDEGYRIRALELRDAIYRAFSAVAANREPPAADVEAINDELCEALAKLEVDAGRGWQLSESDPRERALMLIAISAADLLTSELSARVRECANDTCGWLFIDHSKNRSRRWCSMSDCGNLAKARRFQAKKKS